MELAGIAAAIAIIFYMIINYGALGGMSILSLLSFVILDAAIYIGMFKAVLSLSGIGGFILTLGMAIDSNIILYERFMEELNKGKTPRRAVEDAFRHAFVLKARKGRSLRWLTAWMYRARTSLPVPVSPGSGR